MSTRWFALVPIVLGAAEPAFAGQRPEQAPTPSVLQTPNPLPAPPAKLPPPRAATTFATAGEHPAPAPAAAPCAAPADCGHHDDRSCCQRICDWLLYRPLKSCACHHHCHCGCAYIPTPPLYLYFLGECKEGCGDHGCGAGGCHCHGAWRNGCATGHAMFAPPTGHNCCGGIN
jgi:hypothetical protein